MGSVMLAGQLKAEISGLNESVDRSKLIYLRNKLHEIEPGDHDNTCEYARLLLIGDNSEKWNFALGLLDSIIASTNANLSAFLRKADFFIMKGRYDEALASLAEASRFHPTNYWPNIRRARINSRIGNFDLAKTEIANCTDRKEDKWTNIDLFDAYVDVVEREALAARSHFDIKRISGPAIDNAAALILAKDEEDIIGHNLAHHYREGLRKFVIVDNGSSDETLARIKTFKDGHPDCLVYVILDPVMGHYQAAKTNAGFAFIRTYFEGLGQKIKWLFPIDSDEFICSTTDMSLAALLAKSEQQGKNIVAFNMHNAGSSNYVRDIEPDEDVIGHFDLRKSPPKENVFKVAVNCEAIAGAVFEEGNHRIERGFKHFSEVSAAIADGFFLFHLPMRSVRHIRSKVINGGKAFRAAPEVRNVGGHWRRWHQQYEAQGEDLFPRLVESYLSGLR
jgi:tetratricopeptide (TPR) repeat protein